MRIGSWILGLGVAGLLSAAPAFAHETPQRERGERHAGDAACAHGHGHLEYPVGVHVHTKRHRIYHARGRYVSPYDRPADSAYPYGGWGYGPHVIVETNR